MKEKNPFVENIRDRIMLLPVLRLFYPYYKKKEKENERRKKSVC